MITNGLSVKKLQPNEKCSKNLKISKEELVLAECRNFALFREVIFARF